MFYAIIILSVIVFVQIFEISNLNRDVRRLKEVSTILMKDKLKNEAGKIMKGLGSDREEKLYSNFR